MYLHALSSTPTAPSAASPLPLHDALPICPARRGPARSAPPSRRGPAGRSRRSRRRPRGRSGAPRSEEHTSELQSRGHLVCRLLLEKKKRTIGRHKVRDRSLVLSEVPTATG